MIMSRHTKKKKKPKNASKEAEIKEQCEHCNIDIDDDEVDALGCEICDKWSCRECIKVPADVYKYLETNTEAFPFICKVCTTKLPELREMIEVKNKITSIENQQQEDQTKLTSLELQVQELTQAQQQHTEEVKQLRLTLSEMKVKTLSADDFPEMLASNPPQRMIEMISNHMQPALKPMINTEISERDQIEVIKHNLMISGIPENLNKQDDLIKFTQIIKDEMDIIAEIESAERIPRKTESEKPKLLRVVFKDMKMRKAVLSKATTLRQSQNEDVKTNVFIRPELTKRQLEESKNLTTQLRAKREANKDNPLRTFKIYRGKIIETTVPQPETTTPVTPPETPDTE